MRTKNRKLDFSAISRRSMRRDFEMMQSTTREEKRPQSGNLAKIGDIRRVVSVNDNSSYYKYRSRIEGRLVRLVEHTEYGWRCEFVNHEDRIALNAMAGWSERKDIYLFDSVKFS